MSAKKLPIPSALNRALDLAALGLRTPDSASASGLETIGDTLKWHIRTNGWLILTGLTYEGDSRKLLALSRYLGSPASYCGQRMIADVRPSPGENSSFHRGGQALALHTDKAFIAEPPRVLMLWCCQPDQDGGGITKVCDGLAVFRTLPSELRWALTSTMLLFKPPAHVRERAFEGTIVSEHGGKRLLRYRLDLMTSTEPPSAQFTRALSCLTESLETEATAHLLSRDELLILDNHRILHGRMGIPRPALSNRHLLRMYLD